jgi:hypothetical protein
MHTVSSKLISRHGEDTISTDDDLEAFLVRRGGCTHGSRVSPGKKSVRGPRG